MKGIRPKKKVELTICRIAGDHNQDQIVFHAQDTDKVHFMGKGMDGEYLPNGIYWWHSRISGHVLMAPGNIILSSTGNNGQNGPGDLLGSGAIIVARTADRVYFINCSSAGGISIPLGCKKEVSLLTVGIT